MKIVFLCGALEPGYDGVGDYTRLLALEIIKQGHQSSIIALNDRFVQEANRSIQNIGEQSIEVLRLPAAIGTQERMKLAREWIDELNPDYISLQFVIFSFHPKGIPLTLNKALKTLGRKRKWHLMLHELWVGAGNETDKKIVIWGYVQRIIIKRMVAFLAPHVIHTQTKLYQRELSNHGLKVNYLPLFSNIPVHSLANSRDTPNIQNGNEIKFVIFGSIHPDAPVEAFTNELAAYAKAYKINISLTVIGRCGEQQQLWETIWKSKGLKVDIMGEQTPEGISDILSKSSLGISTTPISLAEKSGSIAAMTAHGLPVICVNKTFKVQNGYQIQPPAGIIEYRTGIIEDYLRGSWGKPVVYSVTDVATELVNSLL